MSFIHEMTAQLPFDSLLYTQQLDADLTELLFDRIPQQQVFEDNLWDAADRLRASARLKSSEYAAPLLGLFFLRYATNRFNDSTPEATAELEANLQRRNAQTTEQIYIRLCGFYLPEAARYETLLALSDKDNVQQKVVDAMEAFETANPNAFGSGTVELPKNDYRKIPDKTLREVIGKVSEIRVAEGDVFGKIYEYFLGKFALSEGQKGGEFYTPTSVVKLIVEILEPHDGRIFDPACGTGGMFVQSAKFIRSHAGTPHISIYGQEKIKETTNLAKLNLFVNGLKGDIRNLDSSLSKHAYELDYADTMGKFDFVMANPPFNVDGVQLEEIGGHSLFSHYGLPISTAKSGKKADTFSNANYLWVSLFATALNPTGREGFVMANSASDARGGEAEVRANLVESGIVDVMITLASNFFYTVTLPVTLWFFDKAKTQTDADGQPTHSRHDQTLFIDARRIYNQVTRAYREFTQAQLHNITAIVWLYRGEIENFHNLRDRYARSLTAWREQTITRPSDDGVTPPRIYVGIQAHRERLAGAFRQLATGLRLWFETAEHTLTDEARTALADNPTWTETLDEILHQQPTDLPDKAAITDAYKRADEAVTFADKRLRPEKDKAFNRLNIRVLLRELTTQRDDTLFVLERMGYFQTQLDWLDSHFPDATYRDVLGLCRISDRADIAAQQYSLNPGRYVGVALDDDGLSADEFRAMVQTKTQTLADLHAEADALQRAIAKDVTWLFMDLKTGETI